jgi:hypothetical protein
MSSLDLSKPRHEISNLMGLAFRAAEDLHSQAGRVGDNINLARNFGQTILANGIIDDRKFLVSTSPKTPGGAPRRGLLLNGLGI